MLTDRYIQYVSSVKRYSKRTCEIYAEVLSSYLSFNQASSDTDLLESLTPQCIRAYEVELMDARGLNARTVGLHLSVLSGFCRYLINQGMLKSNPVRLVTRPKVEKRLPVFYREESMHDYFKNHTGVLEYGSYRDQLDYMIVSLLYGTGMRRSELISLQRSSIDSARNVLHVHGKGDKMREIPIVPALMAELLLYLQVADSISFETTPQGEPLLRTPKGSALYPVYVDKAVKKELGTVGSITGRRSPHVLRHTISTELLDGGADLNSIKELLGHSSLAATQVYTHNSIERLKNVYKQAHPRAKNGGQNGNQD